MTDERIGDSALAWGTTDETWGYIEVFSEEESVEESTVTDGAGKIVAAEHYNKTYPVTGTYVYKSTGTGAPHDHVGDGNTVTMSNGITASSVYIRRVTHSLNMGDWRKADFEGTWWPNLGS